VTTPTSTMMPSRWGSGALRLQSLASARLAARPMSPLAARCRSTHARLGRVQNPLSRVLQQYKPSYCSRHISVSRNSPSLSNTTILESRFPRKTALFLTVLGGLAYYFVDVIDVPQDWVEDVYNGYAEDAQLATPLHFYHNKEELDHYLQFHKPDPGSAFRNPDAARFLSEQFEQLACGWMISPEDARNENVPVTHGCRFKVNSPCVSAVLLVRAGFVRTDELTAVSRKTTIPWELLPAPERHHGITGLSWMDMLVATHHSTCNGR
jgi:hypothetical protein